MNQIIIKGRLTRDPEIKEFDGGSSACRISVAVDRQYSSNGERQTDFFDVCFWNKSAEFVSKYFSKGKEILVSGEMQSRSWTDSNGNKRISWEIGNARAEFCGSNGSLSNDNNLPSEEKEEVSDVENISASRLPF